MAHLPNPPPAGWLNSHGECRPNPQLMCYDIRYESAALEPMPLDQPTARGHEEDFDTITSSSLLDTGPTRATLGFDLGVSSLPTQPKVNPSQTLSWHQDVALSTAQPTQAMTFHEDFASIPFPFLLSEVFSEAETGPQFDMSLPIPFFDSGFPSIRPDLDDIFTIDEQPMLLQAQGQLYHLLSMPLLQVPGTSSQPNQITPGPSSFQACIPLHLDSASDLLHMLQLDNRSSSAIIPRDGYLPAFTQTPCQQGYGVELGTAVTDCTGDAVVWESTFIPKCSFIGLYGHEEEKHKELWIIQYGEEELAH